MALRLFLKRTSRIKSSMVIRELFSFKHRGKALRNGMVEIRYRISSASADHFQVAFLVGKRSIPRANDRNFIKRRLREVFRLNQQQFQSTNGLQLLIIYRSRKIHTYHEIKEELVELLELLHQRISGNA